MNLSDASTKSNVCMFVAPLRMMSKKIFYLREIENVVIL